MKRVLLVDDDPMLQELFDIGLQSEGFEVVVVADGEAAQRAVDEAQFDAIVLDILMPVMDGVRFAHWLRKDKGLRTPVLILSVMAEEEKVQALASYENIDFLSKPVGLEKLLEKLHVLMRK